MGRKIFSFILVVAFLFSTIGYYPVFRMIQRQVREEISREIQCPAAGIKITVFSFSLEEFGNLHWIERNSEFIAGSEMYDVISVRIEPGRVYLNCINDKKEKNLISGLEQYAIRQLMHTTSTSSAKQQIVLLLVKDFLPVTKVNPGTGDMNDFSFPGYGFSCIQWKSDLADPPPRLLS